MATLTAQTAVARRDFAIPYWDWRVVRDIDPLYRANGGFASLPVRNGSPVAQALNLGSPADLDDDWTRITTTLDENEFFGYAPGTVIHLNARDNMFAVGGFSFSGVHATAHVEAGGWMASLAHSARQPLFYAHHANVDRAWDEWTKNRILNGDPFVKAVPAPLPAHGPIAPGGNAPTVPAPDPFRETIMEFPNENGEWESVRAIDMAETAAHGDPLGAYMGYVYQ